MGHISFCFILVDLIVQILRVYSVMFKMCGDFMFGFQSVKIFARCVLLSLRDQNAVNLFASSAGKRATLYSAHLFNCSLIVGLLY